MIQVSLASPFQPELEEVATEVGAVVRIIPSWISLMTMMWILPRCLSGTSTVARAVAAAAETSIA
jgi:hypothetical protein